jgi:hypothetical protein
MDQEEGDSLDHQPAKEEEQRPQKDGSLGRWTNKWSFILRSDKDLSEAGADVALKQLDEIVSHDFERTEQSEREKQEKTEQGLLDLQLHEAIDLDQKVTLSAELLKEKVENEGRLEPRIQGEISDTLTSISSSSMENGKLLQDARKKLKEIENSTISRS